MKRFSLLAVLAFSIMGSFSPVHAQEKHTVAVFAPLFLDSAFNEFNDYRYAKNVFPKFINPGLEFYEGVQLALDSLAREGANLEVFVYDTRSRESIQQQLGRSELKGLDLIIAHCSGSEVKTFADYGLENNIPVINTTMPHDGGSKANPYLVVLNPTLKTQVEGVYKFIQKYYSINPVVVFRKKGGTEDQIKAFLEDYTKNTVGVPLRLRYIDLPEGFTPGLLKTYLDTVRKTAVIAGSLDPAFGRQLATHLASINATHQSVVLGMPTWDGKDFAKAELKGLEIIYSNPFYNSRTDKTSESLVSHFTERLYARPSDMVFRGFQSTYKYGKLLQKYGSDLSSNLGNKLGNIFYDLDIQPVLNKDNMNLEYFENKRLYFLKWQDGEIKNVVSL